VVSVGLLESSEHIGGHIEYKKLNVMRYFTLKHVYSKVYVINVELYMFTVSVVDFRSLIIMQAQSSAIFVNVYLTNEIDYTKPLDLFICCINI